MWRRSPICSSSGVKAPPSSARSSGAAGGSARANAHGNGRAAAAIEIAASREETSSTASSSASTARSSSGGGSSSGSRRAGRRSSVQEIRRVGSVLQATQGGAHASFRGSDVLGRVSEPHRSSKLLLAVSGAQQLLANAARWWAVHRAQWSPFTPLSSRAQPLSEHNNNRRKAVARRGSSSSAPRTAAPGVH